jgi:hypothetical protein
MSQPPSIMDQIKLRFSCRTYTGKPLVDEQRERLAEAAGAIASGPFGTPLRFRLVAAAPADERALKRLGTYGTIRGATAYLVGAARLGPKYLEDYGYAMERLVLEATEIGLGTCWVGGLFTRGTFARRIGATRDERLPAVVAVGQLPDRHTAEEGIVRRSIGGSRRRPWEVLFHDAEARCALTPGQAGPWADALEMARRAPSASNRQPWRVVRSGGRWHFFLRRTPGYPPRTARFLLGVEDLPRVDMGIAMCHFELTAREKGLPGRWVEEPPSAAPPDGLMEYTATWEE